MGVRAQLVKLRKEAFSDMHCYFALNIRLTGDA